MCYNSVYTYRQWLYQFTLQKGSAMNMVYELKCFECHPMPIPQIDIFIYTLPYPIKRINFGA